MRPSPPSPFRKHLDCIKDPRRHNTRHLFHEILMIAICALIIGADSWTQVAEYGRSKFDWLIKTLALRGAMVTIDAMGCQKKITQTILEGQADYVIQVKDNQKRLHEDIALFFQEPANGPFDACETVDGEHGRIETRRYFTTNEIG